MKLRYIELPTDSIFNWLDPFNITAKWACKAITGDWWSEENVAIRNHFASIWTKEFDNITGHFTNLEESIKKKGILSPILIESGPPRGTYLKPFHYPPAEQDDLSHALHTFLFGGSRLTIANKLGIEKIPCVVYDYANMFPNAPQLTKGNFRNWFGNEYVFIDNMKPPQIRCTDMTSKTRSEQQDAATVAREKTYSKFGLQGDI